MAGLGHDLLDLERHTQRMGRHIRFQKFTQSLKHRICCPLPGVQIPARSDSQDQMHERIVAMAIRNQVALSGDSPSPDTAFREYPGCQRGPVHGVREIAQVNTG